MKVKLINVAEYDLKEGKTSDMPFETFKNLCGGINCSNSTGKLPKVRLFKTMSEFINLSAEDMEEIDKDKDIKILTNGQFLVFLKDVNEEEDNTEVKKDAPTDTKENKGK